MVRPIVQVVPIRGTKSQRGGRADLAMSVLQYGTAIVAIVAVTLLAGIR